MQKYSFTFYPKHMERFTLEGTTIPGPANERRMDAGCLNDLLK